MKYVKHIRIKKVMKEIVFNRKNYKTYKDFYTQIYKDLDGKSIPDWEDYQDLCYSADALNEFLWYCHNDNLKFVFVNFDKEKIALQKNYDDYEYNIVFKVFDRFVKNYQNNQLIVKMEEQQ